MSVTPFEQSTRQLHPADILRPYMNEIGDAGLIVREHNHGEDFHVFKFFPIADRGQKGSMQIFSRLDGLIELAYQNKSHDPLLDFKWTGLYGSSNFEPYDQFEDDLIVRLNDIGFSKRMKLQFSLGKNLYDQYYITEENFDETPSEIYANWQQSRGNRDGMTRDGQSIPHLT